MPTTHSQIIFHHHRFASLYLLPCHPQPLPSGHHHSVICVSAFPFYSPYMSEIIWVLVLSDCPTSLSMKFLRSNHVVINGSVSFFLMAEWSSATTSFAWLSFCVTFCTLLNHFLLETFLTFQARLIAPHVYFFVFPNCFIIALATLCCDELLTCL